MSGLQPRCEQLAPEFLTTYRWRRTRQNKLNSRRNISASPDIRTNYVQTMNNRLTIAICDDDEIHKGNITEGLTDLTITAAVYPPLL